MNDTIIFSFTKGNNTESCIIDFNNRKIKLNRYGFSYSVNGLINMEFSFDDITGIEKIPRKLFSNEKYQFILNRKRLCAIENTEIAVTVFTLSKSDIRTADEIMQKLCKECNLPGIKKLGEIDVISEIYEYQYSPDLVGKMP